MEEDKKPVGIKELAKMAGVSTGTIDRVIHKRDGVSDETRRKVLLLIEETGYNPNPIARRLAGFKNTYKIALLMPSFTVYNPYWLEYQKGFEKASAFLSQFGIDVVTFDFDPYSIESFVNQSKKIVLDDFSGCIVAPIIEKEAAIFTKELMSLGKPVIHIDTAISDSKITSFIGQDSYLSGYVAGKISSWPASKANSKILVCHITNRSTLSINFGKREQGFTDYLVHQKKLNEQNIYSIQIQGESEEQVNLMFEKEIAKHNDVSCIFIPNARVFMLRKALEKRKDIFVVGYDLTFENRNMLKDGLVDVLISQKPEMQCTQAMNLIYDLLIAKKTVKECYEMPVDIVVKENLDIYYKYINS